MKCIFSPVPVARCGAPEPTPRVAGEEVLSPALAPLGAAVLLLALVLARTIRRRP